MGQKLFMRGVPTEPDVITLTALFGVPSEGAPLSYESVAKAIGVSVDSHRFKTVTYAWRRGLRSTHGIVMMARDGHFHVRTPSERVAYGKAKTKSGVQCFVEAVDVVIGTNRARLSDREKADCDKVQRIASLAQSAALAEARKRPAPALRAVEKTAPKEASAG